MPIERDFLDGDGSLPILFRVSDTFEVWDGQMALVIDHLLNHMKVLTDLAEGPADLAVLDTLAKYPHYQLERDQIERAWPLSERSRAAIAERLIAECTALLKCLVTIAPIMQIDQADRSRVLEKVRARVPFMDYRYIDAPHLSDAHRED
jgi:hypothetical protein